MKKASILLFGILLLGCWDSRALGRLIINEVMINPQFGTSANTNWIEVYNPANVSIPLLGYNLIYRQNGVEAPPIAVATTIAASIGAFGYILIGNNGNTATNGGLVMDYVLNFPPFQPFGYGDNAISVRQVGKRDWDAVLWNTLTPDLFYDKLPFAEGNSISRLSPSSLGFGLKNWKQSEVFINCTSGSKGSPGKVNTYTCPAPTKAPVKPPTTAPTKAPTNNSPTTVAFPPVAVPPPPPTPLVAPSAVVAPRAPTGNTDPAPTKTPVRLGGLDPVPAPVATPVVAPTTAAAAPTTRPTVFLPRRCGLLRLSILCLNGCGLFGRLLRLCSA